MRRGANRACLLASWWLLREIEASHAQIKHIEFHHDTLTAMWLLPNSKSDPQALGTERAHSCSCGQGAAGGCPYHAAKAQVDAVVRRFGPRTTSLFPTETGMAPTKAGWNGTFQALAARYGLATHHASGAPRYTGHTARASGAQHLAARGIELWKIQIFGRWSSAAFLRYIRSSPLASMTKLASEAAAREPANAQRTQPLRLQADAAQLEEVEPPPTQATFSVGHPYVVNTTPGGKCHRVLDHSATIPPRQWRTHCGWYFGRGYTEFDLTTALRGSQCRVCFRPLAVPADLQADTNTSSSS